MRIAGTVIKGHKHTIYAKNQPQYLPLPEIVSKGGKVTTRWIAGLRERLKILLTGSIYVRVLTFNKPLQPLQVTVDEPTTRELYGDSEVDNLHRADGPGDPLRPQNADAESDNATTGTGRALSNLL